MDNKIILSFKKPSDDYLVNTNNYDVNNNIIIIDSMSINKPGLLVSKIYTVNTIKNRLELNKIYKDMKKSEDNINIFNLLSKNASRIIFTGNTSVLSNILVYKELTGGFEIINEEPILQTTNMSLLTYIQLMFDKCNYFILAYEEIQMPKIDELTPGESIEGIPGKIIRKWCMNNKNTLESKYILETYFGKEKLNKFTFYNIIKDMNNNIKIYRNLEMSPKFKDYGD